MTIELVDGITIHADPMTLRRVCVCVCEGAGGLFIVTLFMLPLEVRLS